MKKRTTEDIVEKFKEIFVDENYDYSQVIFVDNKKPVKVFCPKDSHGWFEATPRNMIERKKGCPYCGGYTLTADIFVKKAKEVHGDFFDYTKVNYINGKTKVTIGCPVHGDFQIEPNNHTNGKQGCKLCAHDRFRSDYKKDGIEFLEECKKVHNNFYDYTKSVYINNKTDFEIICPIHGNFWQEPSGHRSGRGCWKCGAKKISEHRTQSLDTIIDRCLTVHGDRYDYSKSEYFGMNNKMEIWCKTHGLFMQTPAHHIYGECGCPLCAMGESKWEREIGDFINSLGVQYKKDRLLINPFELDIYIPDKHIAWELNGLYFHSELSGNKSSGYHRNKMDMCDKKGVTLYQIFEDEWRDKSNIVKSMIKSKLGKISDKIFGRKCVVCVCEPVEYEHFLEKNHIQGHVNTSIKLGLYYDNTLVAVMGFNKNHKYEWELNRFCSKLDTNIVGGAQKLLSYFIKTYRPNNIVSYADLRLSRGNLYYVLGFKCDGNVPISYYYTSNYLDRLDKKGFRHNTMPNKLVNYDSIKDEWSNMRDNGYDRIWDCGKLRFLWSKE